MQPQFSRRHAAMTIATMTAIGAASLCSTNTFAQGTYPARPVRMVVPFAPGGGADVVARALAKILGDEMNAQFLVDNRSGAGGVIGTDLVAKSPADGYTLLFAPSSHVVNPAVMQKLPYDTASAFEPISLIASATVLVAVNAKVPAKTLAEFIALARKPENAALDNFGSAGNGTPFHLVSEQFSKATKLNMQHIAYRGGAPAAAALVAGEIPFLFETAITLRPFIQSGAVRALAVTSSHRSPLFPEVPTIAELGYPELTFSNDYGLYAPTGVPPEIVWQVASAVAKAMRSPAMVTTLGAQGTLPVGSSPAELREYVGKEIKRWKLVASMSNITIE